MGGVDVGVLDCRAGVISLEVTTCSWGGGVTSIGGL